MKMLTSNPFRRIVNGKIDNLKHKYSETLVRLFQEMSSEYIYQKREARKPNTNSIKYNLVKLGHKLGYRVYANGLTPEQVKEQFDEYGFVCREFLYDVHWYIDKVGEFYTPEHVSLVVESELGDRRKGDKSKSVELLRDEVEQTRTLKEIICDRIKHYQKLGHLKARPEFRTILNKFVFADPDCEFGLVSTNWDTAIDREADEIVRRVYTNVESSNCFHMHGSVDFPGYVFLPSETSHENYRTDEDNKRHGYNHYLTLKFLQQADRIILYGLSLDPLDAELCQILNSTFTTRSNLKEIIIINPDYNRVRNRVRFLLIPATHIKIKCFVPENLELEV